MFLLSLCLAFHAKAAESTYICFYDQDKDLCEGDFIFSVNNFEEYLSANITVTESVFFEFLASLKSDDVIDLDRFSNSTIVQFKSNITVSQISLSSSNVDLLPADLHFFSLATVFSFNSFQKVGFEACNVTLPDQKITADSLTVDGSSMKSLKSLKGDRIAVHRIFEIKDHFSIPVYSLNENSTFTVANFNTITLSTNIVNSCLEFGKSDSLIIFDFLNYDGKVSIDHNSVSDYELFMTLKCLSHSPYLHFPYLNVNFVGQLSLPQSNWPESDTPIMTITATANLVLPSRLVVAGFIPANVDVLNTLIITPTLDNSGFMKVYMLINKPLTIIQPLLLTQEYNFYINEFASLPKGNVSVSSDPPLMYVNIRKFGEGEHDYVLNGSAYYVLNSLPGKNSTVYVEHLWFDSNLTIPFDLNSISRIRVTDYVKMETFPTYFTPQFIGAQPTTEVNAKFNIICAKLLKEQKEALLLPPNGTRGFVRGASIVTPFFEQDPTTTDTLKCFGINVKGNINTVSNRFCISDNAGKCPEGTQKVDVNEWDKYLTTDAAEVTFYLFNSGVSLSFQSFNNTHVFLYGSSYEKVSLPSEGLSKITAENVEITFTSQNTEIEAEFTNVKFAPDSYLLGNLITDTNSLKTIKNKQFNDVFIQKVDESHITFGQEVKFEQNDVTFEAENTNISLESSNARFTFSEHHNKTMSVFVQNTATVTLDGVESASDDFVIYNFSGILNLKGSSNNIPIVLRDTRNIEISADSKITFTNGLEIGGTFKSNVDVHSKLISINSDTTVETDKLISADDFVISKNVVAKLPKMKVSNNFDVMMGSSLTIDSVENLPSEIRVHYNLADIPKLTLNSLSSVSKVVFVYDLIGEISRNEAVKNETQFLQSGIPIIYASDCANVQFEFTSNYIYYSGEYSLLEAKCVDGSVKLFASSSAVVPPAPTEVPYIPTQSYKPDQTTKQVVIISCTVIAFFLIIVIIITKCMNRKKKYVSKKKEVDMNTQPLLNTHEGNAE
ncbi:hypothetical protein TRFO_10373 [Tritrichomonas foetus]|uniref:Uncharacterized protein n=1 Tax=Tritrichomonas foetus TaxID=1144522 RepID=A0A1J4JE61_9EUKA|nr:hypothetical protein TRFO_10373 [Tritrichomonas foetus]|eukprot:OHS95725.1 hypothetical protein TRFO_10373 [Tritrichomonas foetus]